MARSAGKVNTTRAPIKPTNTLGGSSQPRSKEPKTPAQALPSRRNPPRAAATYETDLSEDSDGVITRIPVNRVRLRALRDENVWMSGGLGPGDWSRVPTTAEEKHAMKAQRAKDEKAQQEAEKRFRKEANERRRERKRKQKEENTRLRAEKAREKAEKNMQNTKNTKNPRSSLQQSALSIPSVEDSDPESSLLDAPRPPSITGSIARPKASPLGPTTIKRRKRASSIFSPDREEQASRAAVGQSPANSSYLATSRFGDPQEFGFDDSEIERNLARQLELDESFLPDQVSASPAINANNVRKSMAEGSSLKRKLSPPNGNVPSSPPTSLLPPQNNQDSLSNGNTKARHEKPVDSRASSPLSNLSRSPFPKPGVIPDSMASSPMSVLSRSPSPVSYPSDDQTPSTKPSRPNSRSNRVQKSKSKPTKRTTRKPSPRHREPSTAELQSLLPRRRNNKNRAGTRDRSASITSLNDHHQHRLESGSLQPSDTASNIKPARATRSASAASSRNPRGQQNKSDIKRTYSRNPPAVQPCNGTGGQNTLLQRSESDKENATTSILTHDLNGKDSDEPSTLLFGDSTLNASAIGDEGEEDVSLFELGTAKKKQRSASSVGGRDKVASALNGHNAFQTHEMIKKDPAYKKMAAKFAEVDDWELEFEDVGSVGVESSPLHAR